MRKMILMLAGLAFGLNQATAQGTVTDKNATGNDSTAVNCDKKCTAMEGDATLTFARDSMKYGMMTCDYDRNAVKMPKYYAFNEKMKNDDWLGGLLKDILY